MVWSPYFFIYELSKSQKRNPDTLYLINSKVNSKTSNFPITQSLPISTNVPKFEMWVLLYISTTLYVYLPIYHIRFAVSETSSYDIYKWYFGSPRKNSLLLLKINVVDLLIKNCGLDFTEQEIFRMLGIIRTNAIQTDDISLKDRGIIAHVVCPIVSYMSHSCISNARCR